MELVPLLLDKKSAAKLLGISVRMLEYLIAQGKVCVRRIGRRVLIPHQSLAQFARPTQLPKGDDRRTPPPQQPQAGSDRPAPSPQKALDSGGSSE